MTSSQKQACEELYREYKELEEKTKLRSRPHQPGKSIAPQTITTEEILRKEGLRKTLVEQCHDFLEEKLNPDELFEIENG